MSFTNKLKVLLSLGTINFTSSIILSIFWLYLASIMSVEKYGELAFLMSIVNMGFAISLLGLPSAVVVYESKNQNIFYPSFIIVIISAHLTALVTYTLTQNAFVSILIVGLVIFEIILAGLNSKQRYNDFSKYKIF